MAAWSKKETQDFSGAFNGTTAPKKPPAVDNVPAQDGETPEEADIGNQQAANLSDPSRAAQLEKMVVARRKFLGK